jgi:hypothetical protein
LEKKQPELAVHLGRMTGYTEVGGHSDLSFRIAVPVQTVDATLAWSLLAGVWKPRVFLGR